MTILTFIVCALAIYGAICLLFLSFERVEAGGVW